MRPITAAERTDFIRSHTALAPVGPLLPDISLYQATEITPIWQATEDWLERQGVPPPFWAFPWAGGQAVARLILDQPDLVAGRHVLDFAAGSGLIAIAALQAGAAAVRAVEIDPFAVEATYLNAAANGVTVTADVANIIGQDLPGIDIVLAGDICYERPFAEAALGWLRRLAAGGTLVLLGDPGRAYLPAQGLEKMASYAVPTTRELEDREVRVTDVWRVPG
ncbi:Predicted nicotinamide N-methyase [Azospirillum sp. RU38E]|nr:MULTISPECIES: 50S ribosomal protein L11 methyltransferase [Azospirillaceae]MDG5495465.1 50S ribosomal protein L11 methyltransferase [Niveispirillum sp. BGYR6]SNS29622.1 Predicted nicotinamide N-methyase [Azospirillum sp. RU38E]SNS48054.1 Predicted nicotinamide N-methyase [Azospirillum sp. RU37A]